MKLKIQVSTVKESRAHRLGEGGFQLHNGVETAGRGRYAVRKVESQCLLIPGWLALRLLSSRLLCHAIVVCFFNFFSSFPERAFTQRDVCCI